MNEHGEFGQVPFESDEVTDDTSTMKSEDVKESPADQFIREQKEKQRRQYIIYAIEDALTSGFSERILFTLEERQAALQSNEKLGELLQRGVVQAPEVILPLLSYWPDQTFFTPDQVKELVQRVTQESPSSWLKNFDTLVSLLPSEKIQAQLAEIVEDTDHSVATAVVGKLNSPNFLKYYCQLPDWKTNLVEKIGLTGFTDRRKLDGAVESGLIDSQMLVGIINKMASMNNLYEAFLLVERSAAKLSEAEKAQIKVVLSKVLGNKDNSQSIFTVCETAKVLFTQAEIEVMADQAIQQRSSYFGSFFDKVSTVFSEEKISEWLHLVLEDKKQQIPYDYFNREIAEYISQHQVAKAEDRQRYANLFIEQRTKWAFNSWDVLRLFFSDSQRVEVAQKLVDMSPPSTLANYSEIWSDLGQAGSVEFQTKNIIKQLENCSVHELSLALMDFELRNLLEKRVTGPELVQIVKQSFDDANTHSVAELIKYIRVLPTSDDPESSWNFLKNSVRELADFLFDKQPVAWVESSSTLYELYSQNEVQEKLQQVFNQVSLFEWMKLFSSLPAWGNLFGLENTRQFLLQNEEKLGWLMVMNIEQVLPFIPIEDRPAWVERVSNSNPALFQTRSRSKLVQQYFKVSNPVLTLLTEDRVNASPLPLTLAERKKSLVKNQDKEARFASELSKIVYMEAQLGFLANAQLVLEFKAFLAKQPQTIQAESAAFDLFIALAALEPTESTIEAVRQVNTMNELTQLLVAKLAEQLGFNDMSNQAAERFMEQMGSVVPFAFYFAQYKKSPEHLTILTNIFNSITENKYKEYKYGRSEELQSYKDQGLLPEGLTPEQYQNWQENDALVSAEVLLPSAKEVAQKINQVIINNVEHLYLSGTLEGKTPQEALAELNQQASAVGKKLGVNKTKLQTLKATMGQTPSEADQQQLGELTKEQIQLRYEGIGLRMIADLVRLTMLHEEEVASGYLQKDGKLTTTINQKIKDIREAIASLAEAGMLDRDELDETLLNLISSYLDQLKDQGLQSEMDLEVEDTDSPQVTIEVGVNPVESCQSYFLGAYNQCLLGYFDPSIKIITIRDASKKILARSVLRLLSEKETNNPGLVVETIYTNNASGVIPNLVYRSALEKATKMGVALYAPMSSQNEQGIMVTENIGKNFHKEESTAILESKGSKAREVYVDSAGGYKRGGKYAVKDLVRIMAATT